MAHHERSSLLMKDGCWQKVYHQLRTRFQSGKIRQLERERQRKRRQHVMGPPHVIRRARHAHLHDRVAAGQAASMAAARTAAEEEAGETDDEGDHERDGDDAMEGMGEGDVVVRTTATLAPTTISTKSKTQLRRRKTRRTRAKAPENVDKRQVRHNQRTRPWSRAQWSCHQACKRRPRRKRRGRQRQQR